MASHIGRRKFLSALGSSRPAAMARNMMKRASGDADRSPGGRAQNGETSKASFTCARAAGDVRANGRSPWVSRPFWCRSNSTIA
jgi:hypothetical protein